MTLLPCPFCGEVPELPEIENCKFYAEIRCKCKIANISISMRNSDSLEEHFANYNGYPIARRQQALNEAIAAWNRRADTSALEQLKARLIEGGARLPVDNLKMNAVECGMSIALALVEEQLRSKP